MNINRKIILSVMTAILMGASLLPMRILAEEEIGEELEQIEEPLPEQEESSAQESLKGISVDPCRHGSVSIQSEMTDWGELCYTVTAVPDDRFRTSMLTAVDENGNSAVRSEGENYIVFYGNSSPVTVHAEFTCIDPSIYTNSKNGQIRVMVNGIETNEAKPGDTITMEFIPDRAYKFTKENMYFVCEEQPEAKWDGNICTFIMPGCGDLGAYASFDYYMKRHIFLRDADEGTAIHTIVEGEKTSDAFCGDSVTLNASVAEGSEVALIRGVNHVTGETLFETAEEYASFTMPDSDVDIYVTCRDNRHSITVDNSSAAHMTVQLLDETGEEMKEFPYGKRVHAQPVSLDGIHGLSGRLSARTATGRDLDVTYSDEEMYFTMPKEDVVISLCEGIQYADENGTKHIRTDCQTLFGVPDQLGATLTSGWYAVEGAGWGFNNRLTVTGDVNLILTDGCHLILNRGIRIYGGGSLSVWGGAQGNGRMDCVQAFETSEGKAGIGGDRGESGGIFNMHGGRIRALGQNSAAAIGGGKNGHGGIINIYGGHLEVWGGEDGAGIGGGMRGCGGTIRIMNGDVHAYGNDNSAAIGGGEYGNGGEITITGGTVIARAENYLGSSVFYAGGAGIGGGEDSNGGRITITGGTVRGYGGSGMSGGGAGIGGGDEADGGEIIIAGGDVEGWGGNESAGIGGGNEGNGGNITIEGGKVRAESTSYGAGIGGGIEATGGSILICGGEVYAKGGYEAAGIGGGPRGNSGRIEIRGGNVTATGGDTFIGAGAGIGGGNNGSGGTVSITSGTICARGEGGGAGIGGGDRGDSGSIRIYGGSIFSTSSKDGRNYIGAGIGAGRGGTEEYIFFYGGNTEAHGFQAVGRGQGGYNGTLEIDYDRLAVTGDVRGRDALIVRC